METDGAQFERRVMTILARFGAQADRVVPVAAAARLAMQLREAVGERGLPRPLRAGEWGAPGNLTEAELTPLVARVTAGLDDAWLTDAARQLVKACFYPEFTDCRDSYREPARDGSCRRQELARVRGRISGSHCVDCPHWTALAPEAHRALLAAEWRGDAGEFAAHREVFLPEDFRALRHWLHAAARRG